MPNKTIPWYIKTVAISIILFIETYILGTWIEEYIFKGDYFNITPTNTALINILITMVIIVITYSLSIGAWDKFEQYLLIPIPVGLALTLILIKYNLYNGITAGLILTLLICYDIYKSTVLKKLLTKFEPKFILSPSIKGILMVFSLFAVLILLFSSAKTPLTDLNIGERIAKFTKEPITKSIPNIQYLDIEPENIIENQINSMIVPYQSFLKPLMAVFVFLVFGFVGSLAYWVFVFLVYPMFYLARKTGFIKIEKVTVEQEKPIF